MTLLRSIKLREPDNLPAGFPFTLAIIRELPELTFDSPVTFFVGENGSGKSTLLEGIAAAVGSTVIGSQDIKHDQSLSHAKHLALALKLVWTHRTHKGFFLRAEDFFGYAKRIAQLRAEMETELSSIDQNNRQRSDFSKNLEKIPYQREIMEIKRRYGNGLDHVSHGESFITLFQSRFVPNGLYLLDEPEAPLSPLRQLGFLSLLKEMVKQNAQFIIATHSPILLAFPDAQILDFDSRPIQEKSFEELPHVTLTKNFLNNPKAYLNHI